MNAKESKSFGGETVQLPQRGGGVSNHRSALNGVLEKTDERIFI